MGRKLLHTPSSKIRSALRRLWLQSRERSQALKIHDYRCACCGAKQSRRQGHECYLDVHHIDGVEWHEVIELIRRYLLVKPERLQPLCEKCHDKLHEEAKNGV